MLMTEIGRGGCLFGIVSLTLFVCYASTYTSRTNTVHSIISTIFLSSPVPQPLNPSTPQPLSPNSPHQPRSNKSITPFPSSSIVLLILTTAKISIVTAEQFLSIGGDNRALVFLLIASLILLSFSHFILHLPIPSFPQPPFPSPTYHPSIPPLHLSASLNHPCEPPQINPILSFPYSSAIPGTSLILWDFCANEMVPLSGFGNTGGGGRMGEGDVR